jgi:ribosomal protein S12 methylthiotransferase
MLTFLQQAGYGFTSDPSKADIIIVNTCGFISSARKESMDTIVEMIEYKKLGTCKRLVVTGCMPQLWLKEMREELPEVDIFLGVDQYPNIAQHLANSFENKETKIIKAGTAETIPYVKGRMVTTPMHYAYLKIADGCDNFCTFCTIPSIRGKYRSRDMAVLLNEAVDLVKNGAQELIIIAQDITHYGEDLYGKPKLVELIQNLSKIKDLRWIRLLYCYPEQTTKELIAEMQRNDKLCNYIDIPLQHVSNNVLKRMNRKTTKEDIESLISLIKSQKNYVAIRTTFMVGFPGETEEDFAELYDFIKKYRLAHVGFFAYSREDGTPAAKMPDQIPEKIKQKRLVELVRLQKKIVAENNKEFIGKTLDVVYEGIDYSKGLFFGRSQYQSPEIDTICYFKTSIVAEIGSVYKIKIKKTKGYDLYGEQVEEN